MKIGQITTVLVYGATGVQASPLVWALQHKGYRVQVLTRDPFKAAAFTQAGVTLFNGDINDLGAVREATTGVDIVALTVPFLAPDEAGRHAIDAAREQGVKLLVWNTSGLIPQQVSTSHGLNVRLKTAQYLTHSGIPHIILQPTGYLDNLLLPGIARGVAIHKRILNPTPAHKKVHYLAVQDLAALMMAAIERPELAGSRFVIGGPTAINGHQLAACFSQALGRSITYQTLPSADYAAHLDKRLSQGAGRAITGAEQLNSEESSTEPDVPVDMTAVLAKLPVSMTSVTDWVVQHRAAFTL